MSDSEVEEEVDYDALSVDELFQNGKSLFREKNYLESAEYFSRALEKKSGEDPSHYSLRDYYLWYADSLLTNEEQSSNIFESSVNEGQEQDLPSAQTVLDAANKTQANQSDETLAFDLFQFANECYLNYFKELESKNREPLPEDVLDASYCLIRIGDMFFSSHQFEESSREYERAIKLREQYNLPLKHLASVYISLAQSQMFNGKQKLSLETFNKTGELLKKMLKEDLKDEERTNLENTLEDVTIQAEDLKKLLAESASAGGQNTKGSQSNAASLIPKTTSTLDERQLDSNMVKSVVININVEDMPEKRRRIDLSKVYE
ncbi:hypothetical protein MACJ_003816 [Theileria orientalis]|uniref:Tetratricopeptide SHNi-TPR domain-containing protein n=1 Tax=Theileria orientalis TaxID=68886 RepID=A0A976SKM2_THEOR|nr:hypothetical protein MACJ_003816 [Theileria orientalis]